VIWLSLWLLFRLVWWVGEQKLNVTPTPRLCNYNHAPLLLTKRAARKGGRKLRVYVCVCQGMCVCVCLNVYVYNCGPAFHRPVQYVIHHLSVGQADFRRDVSEKGPS